MKEDSRPFFEDRLFTSVLERDSVNLAIFTPVYSCRCPTSKAGQFELPFTMRTRSGKDYAAYERQPPATTAVTTASNTMTIYARMSRHRELRFRKELVTSAPPKPVIAPKPPPIWKATTSQCPTSAKTLRRRNQRIQKVIRTQRERATNTSSPALQNADRAERLSPIARGRA